MAGIPTTILLRGGTLLIHNSSNDVISQKADLLITGNLITRISSAIDPPSIVTKIIDCHGKIISPGFIDTHRHMWQTQLKGRHANEVLSQYIFSGNLTGSLYTPRDVFWGNLGGAMESIDAGTTTVVDQSHVVYSPEHAWSALAGTVTSGIRSVFCLSPTRRVRAWSPFELYREMLPDWFADLLRDMAGKQPFGEGRVQLGFGFDSFDLPKETVVQMYNRVRQMGIKVITSHHIHGPIGMSSPIC